LVQAFDLALRLGVVGASVLLLDPEFQEFDFEAVGAVQVSGGEDKTVVCQRGLGCSVSGAGVAEGGDDGASGDGLVGGGGEDES
jgi:hypothetical protein